MKRDISVLLEQGNVSTTEAAKFLGVEESTVRRECDALRLASTRIRGRRTIPIKALVAYRDAHTVGAAR